MKKQSPVAAATPARTDRSAARASGGKALDAKAPANAKSAAKAAASTSTATAKGGTTGAASKAGKGQAPPAKRAAERDSAAPPDSGEDEPSSAGSSDRLDDDYGDGDYGDDYNPRAARREYDDDEGDAAPDSDRVARVELAPRSSATVAPTIPLPVKELQKAPSLEERAASIDKRLSQQSAEFRSAYSASFEMSWIFHDTGLEGTVYTYEELAAAFRSADPATVDSSILPIFDSIKRHMEAIAYLREMVDKKRLDVSIDLIKKIYVTLHPDEGDVKTVKYRRDVPQHRLYFHEYSAPDKIGYKLRNVVDWVNSADTRKNVSMLKMAAKAHYDLVRIYPFPKDSGKVARLFMNLLLMRAGFPPAIIHHSERQRYYDALKAGSPTAIVQMLRDSVENSLSSIEKLLDEHEHKTRAFVT